MPELGARWLLGLLLSLAIGGLAYRRGSLTAGGAAGAVAVGTLVFGLGGWVWAGTLVAFFVSSSALSHYQERRKSTVAEEFAKGSRRDLAQVLANGGMAGLLALAVGLTGKASPVYPLLALGYFGSVAAANADTWATELGVLARGLPRLITTRRRVPAGTSGGVTPLGTLAALAGALFIGLVAFLLIQGAAVVTTGRPLLTDWVVIPVAAVSGFVASLFDSLLGATVQATYVCPVCRVETERRMHRCGQATQHSRGWGWLDNDGVNFIASLTGALAAVALGACVVR
jgi:uncharacterized protein (TIGR00297 family)